MAKRDVVQSVERALSLLFRISLRVGNRPGLAELAESLDIDRSSAHRLLTTLMQYDLVRQDETKRSYQLGFGIFTLAGRLRNQSKITNVAQPYLRKLATATGENAHLAVRSGTWAVFIDRERASNTLSANTSIGDTEELYCTAVGKALICDLDRSGLDALFEGVHFTRYTDRTIMELDALEDDLEHTQHRGFALDREEYDGNVTCIAAPIRNFEGKIEAAIGISGPRNRVEPNIDDFSHLIRDAGREISRMLGDPVETAPAQESP